MKRWIEMKKKKDEWTVSRGKQFQKLVLANYRTFLLIKTHSCI